LHGVDVVESVGMIDFNCFDLITSNIIGNNSDVESMTIDATPGSLLDSKRV
jgi:hypothetical protein